MSKSVSKNRKIGPIIAYTTLACGLVSLGVYVYREQQKRKSPRSDGRNSNTSTRNGVSPDWNSRASLDNGSNGQDDTRSSELQPKTQQQQGLTIQEQDELKQQQQVGLEREREQILTMLRNAGLILPAGTRGPKLIDPRQLLICETEEGVSHVVRHLESQVHVDALQSVVEMVQGVVPKVVFVQKRPGHSRASSVARDQQQNGQMGEVMTQSHVRVRSSSGSSSSGSGSDGSQRNRSASSSSSRAMGDSFVEVIKNAGPVHEPLVSGYVTQAGKKGYVEVTDQLKHSSLNPENSSK